MLSAHSGFPVTILSNDLTHQATRGGTELAPWFFNPDFSVGKQFRLSEARYFDFRGELFKPPRSVSLGPPARNIRSTATFGQITSQVNRARNIQFGLKFFFWAHRQRAAPSRGPLPAIRVAEAIW